jgi:L-ascorbate metabolism protein UlaG (beta-lactamase superfamily)
VCDYHGFLGTREALIQGLNRVKEARPALLVPSHGNLMRDPAKAIGLLAQRFDRCYDKYVAISALRHYFPDMFKDFVGRPGHMPIRKGKEVPACLRHFDTTWMIVSKDKAAFVIDVCGPNTAKQVQKLVESGEIRYVDGMWITHYHYDHVDGIPDLLKLYDCPVITDSHVADVVSDPLAWRLTCISPHVIRVDQPTRDGETWPWHEFKMTAYHFPGQTLYHSGLLVESDGLRMLFAGDSYTMSGIDDYCTHNRNWLGKGLGFDYCLELTARLKPTHIFNEHVDPAFDFADEEIAFMRANLAEREKLYGEIVPWDHANYGMDEQWARCFPYEQKARPGAEVAFRVVITNHSPAPRKAAARAVLPSAWGRKATEWAGTAIAPKKDGEIRLAVRVPPGAQPGRTIIPVDLKCGDWDLPQFTEAIVVVE